MNTSQRKKEERKIDNSLESLDKFIEDIPISSIFSGVNISGKNIDTSNLMLEKPNLENYAKYSSIIKDYFMSVEKNHKQFALMLGKLFSDNREKNVQEFITKLEDGTLKTQQEVRSELETMLVGDSNSNSHSLIFAISKLYDMNNSVMERFKEKAKKQNEIYKFLEENKRVYDSSKIELKRIMNLFDLKRGEDDYKNFARLEKTLQNALAGGELKEGRVVKDYLKNFKEKFPSEYKEMGGNHYNIVYAEYQKIKKANAMKMLKDTHERSVLASRVFVIKALQSKRSKALGMLFYQSGMSADEIQKNKIEVEDYISQSIQSIKLSNPKVASAFSPEVIKDITREITERFIEAKTKRDKELLEVIDEKGNKVSSLSNIPPDTAIEEEFVKITEDTIYNSIMKQPSLTSGLSGLQAYNQMVRNHNDDIDRGYKQGKKYEELEEAIDIQKNIHQGNYEPPSRGGKDYKLAMDAMTLWNMRTVAKSISNGTTTKEEASKALEKVFESDTTRDIPTKDKKVLKDELMNNFNNKEFAQSFEGKEAKGMKVGDIISVYNAKRFYANLYSRNLLGTLGIKNYKISSRNALELQTCLESAASPKINSHSGASEIGSCLEKYKNKLKEDSKELKQAASQPMVALSGLSLLAIFAASFKDAGEYRVERNLNRIERERIKTISFYNEAVTSQDKYFRSMVIKNDKFNMSSDIVEKKNLDEWIFKAIEAKHDYEIYNDTKLREMVDDLKNAKTQDESIESFRENIKNILNSNGIRKQFNSFNREAQAKMAQDFEETKAKFQEKMGWYESALSQGDFAIYNDNKDAFSEQIKDLDKAMKSGALSLREVKQNLEELGLNFQKQMKISEELLEKEINREANLRTTLEKYKDPLLLTSEDLLRKENLLSELKNTEKRQKLLLESTKNLSKIATEMSEFNSAFTIFNKNLEENPNLFSQSFAYGDDKEASIEALKERYLNGKFSKDTIAQDLKLIDDFQNQNKNTFSTKQKKSINQMKVLMKKLYIESEKARTGGEKSDTEIFKELYDEKKEVLSTASELDFTILNQANKKDVQVIMKEKGGSNAPNQEVEESINDALDTIKKNQSGIFEDPEMKISKEERETLEEDTLKAYRTIKNKVGIDISLNANKGTKEGEGTALAERTAKSINNDDTKAMYAAQM